MTRPDVLTVCWFPGLRGGAMCGILEVEVGDRIFRYLRIMECNHNTIPAESQVLFRNFPHIFRAGPPEERFYFRKRNTAAAHGWAAAVDYRKTSAKRSQCSS